MPDRPLTNIKAIPLRGGAVTSKERAQLPLGGFSMIKNMRPRHPGFEQRGGLTRKHTTEEGNNKVMSLYQFSKGKRVERHFFAQFANGNVLEAKDAPPIVTTGTFGADVHDSDDYTKMIPASWGNIDDLMIYSNGVDQHQIYAGTANYVQKFVKFDAAAAPPTIPSDGYDYTKEVTDGLSTTFAVLNSLDTYANHECVFICTPVPANKLTWIFVAGHKNTNAAVGTLSYKKNDNTWADTKETDGTITSGKTLGQNGSMEWEHPTDEIPSYMFGMSGFWYRWETSAQLSSEVELYSLTYGSGFQDMRNVWCGIPEYAIEAKFYDASNSVYQTGNLPRTLPTSSTTDSDGVTLYSTDSITLNDMAATNDRLYFNSPVPIEAFYADPGECCNTSANTTIDKVYHWTGAAFTQIASITDGTDGLSHAGWVTLNKTATERIAAQPTQFQNAKYYSYWYYFTVDTTLSSNVIISLEVMPQYDIADLGIGQCNGVWKNRALLTFDKYPQYVYISAQGKPMVLNGPDSTIMRAGDGRANRVVCMKPFYNEQLVWQKEVGKEGGTLSLFQGDNPKNMKEPLVLSSTIGTFNAKSAIVVDGVLDNFSPQEGVEEKEKTFAFWLSNKGVFCTDGITVFRFSHDIQNYFDPQKDECIRRGYDNEHWIAYDSSENVLRLGLVSGEPLGASTATSTVPYKLVDTAGAFTTVKTSSNHPIKHKIAVGDTVYNTTDNTSALVVSVNSAIELTLDTDIMASGEGYVIYSATPNLFPVFDLTDKTWSFDEYGVNLSCMTEVEAGSLNVPVLQYAGGVGGEAAAAGVFRLNTGTNDVDMEGTSNAIDANFTMEFNSGGLIVSIREILARMKVQPAGNCTLTPYQNTRAGTTITLPMTAKTSGDAIRRHRFGMKLDDQAISLKFQNNTVSQSIFMEEIGVDLLERVGH